MKKLFDELLKQALCTQCIRSVDVEITFHSSAQELTDLFTGPLRYLLPTEGEEKGVAVTCVVAPTTAIDNWPDCLSKEATEITPIDGTIYDNAHLMATPCGMTLMMENIGSLYHSGAGEFLCLVCPPERQLRREEFQNVLGLATLLVSEVLLLTGKLLIHAGAVGSDGRGWIWTGESGSGKTTRILTLVNRGLDFYGEDQIIIGRDAKGDWRVWPFWRKIRVTAETSKLFPTSQDLSIRPPDARKKYSFDNIEEVLLVDKPASATISSIIKLAPGNGGILRELDFNEAFAHLAPGFMHSLLPDSTTRVMDIVLDLIADIPVCLVSWDMLDQFDRQLPID